MDSLPSCSKIHQDCDSWPTEKASPGLLHRWIRSHLLMHTLQLGFLLLVIFSAQNIIFMLLQQTQVLSGMELCKQPRGWESLRSHQHTRLDQVAGSQLAGLISAHLAPLFVCALQRFLSLLVGRHPQAVLKLTGSALGKGFTHQKNIIIVHCTHTELVQMMSCFHSIQFLEPLHCGFICSWFHGSEHTGQFCMEIHKDILHHTPRHA